MGFNTTLQADMVVILVPEVGRGPTRLPVLFLSRGQLPLFLDKASAEAFPKTCKVPPGYVFMSTEKWEKLYWVLERAKELGADSVAFVASGKEPKATSLEAVMDEVRDLLSGKHDGNPTSPN